ncbi:unnamed protein product [Prorocentrum cordatum]|uniref:Uncharacterized protein n=1 Tax=Prorocentrum cordatum TaxID=2364126 RepID=A0ABN9S3T4_9DINO|nr:unnamed protein product [Polarella glacialis]
MVLAEGKMHTSERCRAHTCHGRTSSRLLRTPRREKWSSGVHSAPAAWRPRAPLGGSRRQALPHEPEPCTESSRKSITPLRFVLASGRLLPARTHQARSAVKSPTTSQPLTPRPTLFGGESPPPSFGSESARSRAPARPTESSTSGRRAAREAQGGAHERPPRFRATEAQARRGRGGGAGSTGRGSRGSTGREEVEPTHARKTPPEGDLMLPSGL